MATKNKSQMAKGIRSSVLNEAKTVDSKKESDSNLQTAASIAKIAVTLDGFTAATLGSDKNLEDVFLDILDELKAIPTSLRELEKKNSKVIESITTAILKLEKELEGTNDPKKQKALIEAIAKLKGEGKAAIDKSEADKPKKPIGPTSIKELVSGAMGVTPESTKAAGGSRFRAFTSALKKDARATFGLATPDTTPPIEPQTIEDRLEERRTQKTIGNALGDERLSVGSSHARRENISNRDEDRGTAKASPNETKTSQSSIFAGNETKTSQSSIFAGNETKTSQSSIFAGADSGSDPETPNDKLLEVVTNIDGTTTKILKAIESGSFGGNSGGGLNPLDLLGNNPKGTPKGPKAGVFSKVKGVASKGLGLLKGNKGKIGLAIAAASAAALAYNHFKKKDTGEEDTGEEGTSEEGTSEEDTGVAGKVAAGVGATALGGAALYSGLSGAGRDAGFIKAPTAASRLKNVVGNTQTAASIAETAAGAGTKVAGAGLKGALGTAGKLAGKAALPLAIALEAVSAGSDIMDASKAEKAGEITHQEANVRKGSAAGGGVGAVGGMWAGAAAGAAIGSVVPIFGTAIGGIIGGMAGAYLGKEAGKKGGELLAKGLTKNPEVMAGDASGRIAQANAVEGSTVPTNAAAPVINNTTNNVNNVTNGGQSSHGADISLRDTHSSYMRFRDNRMARVM